MRERIMIKYRIIARDEDGNKYTRYAKYPSAQAIEEYYQFTGHILERIEVVPPQTGPRGDGEFWECAGCYEVHHQNELNLEHRPLKLLTRDILETHSLAGA
jgi:hypothetical protein